ncbi:hypothetical protein D1007_34416 [Hordeum vulgare]|nr:hypothetical protein D1007_34416 [Hordeum vulgare]
MGRGAHVATSLALVVVPPEPPKHPKAVVLAPFHEGQALEGPRPVDAPMLATSGQPSEHPVLRDDASMTATPRSALGASQEEVLKTSVFAQSVLNGAFGTLGKVMVAMANGEKEAKAARAACEEAKEGGATATKHCQEAKARLKALQEEQAKLGEQHHQREEELTTREAKLAAWEQELSQEENHLGAKQARLDKKEKELASRKALLDAKGEALTAAERKKVAELVGFPDVDLKLCTTLRSLLWDGFNEPLANPESSAATLVAELVVGLENTVVQVDKILDSECCDLFFEAATRIFSHLHLRESGFDFGSVILQVPTEARHSATEAVKGPVEALMKRFARVATPSSPDVVEADDGEDDAFDADVKPLEDGATGGGGSS